MKMTKKRREDKRMNGFTLIELLAVVAIIGLLSTMLMTSLNIARSKARDARRLSDIHQMRLALQLYYDSSGHYPAQLADLVPTYISAAPFDPDGISEYQYCTNTKKSNYHLGTRIEGLEIIDSAALLTDADAENDGCSGGNSFPGTDPVYDIVP